MGSASSMLAKAASKTFLFPSHSRPSHITCCHSRWLPSAGLGVTNDLHFCCFLHTPPVLFSTTLQMAILLLGLLSCLAHLQGSRPTLCPRRPFPWPRDTAHVGGGGRGRETSSTPTAPAPALHRPTHTPFMASLCPHVTTALLPLHWPPILLPHLHPGGQHPWGKQWIGGTPSTLNSCSGTWGTAGSHSRRTASCLLSSAPRAALAPALPPFCSEEPHLTWWRNSKPAE